MADNKITVSHMEQLMPIITESLEAGKSVQFNPRGISMLPMLRQDIDSVVLSPLNGKLKKYDIPLYKRDNGKYVLHRVVEASETYTCIGDNQYVYEKGIRDDQIIAVVTSFTRGDKKISVNNFSYRLYCRIWHYSRPMRHFARRAIRWIGRHI